MSYMNNTIFSKSVRYIFDNIDQAIELDDIAASVGVSVSILKRLFVEATHRSPGAFIRRMRMERAFRTLNNNNDAILEIALASGFDDPSAFTRCFKQTFGYPPKEARKKLNIVNELECVELCEPEIIELADMRLQSITETGLYFESAPRAWDKLSEKLSEHELCDDFSGLFIGIGHDNPHDGTIADDRVRYSACIAYTQRHLEIEDRVLSGGKYARFHYIGKVVNLGLAYHYIYGKRSENSGYKIHQEIPAFVAHESFPDGLIEQRLMINVPLEEVI